MKAGILFALAIALQWAVIAHLATMRVPTTHTNPPKWAVAAPAAQEEAKKGIAKDCPGSVVELLEIENEWRAGK